MGIFHHSRAAMPSSCPLPTFTELQLPPVTATVPATSGQNTAAQAQFETLMQARAGLNVAPQTFEWFSPSTGIAARREFRVVEGVLQENRPGSDGVSNWVAASTPSASRGEPGVQQLFLADGHLYRSDGTLVGRFGVNSNAVASEAVGGQFLRTFGTLHDPSGRLIDYSAATLSLGGQPTVIQVGPPPGMVAIYRPSTRNVLVESNSGTAFREIGGDVAFERLWVPPAQSAEGANIRFTRTQVLAFPRQQDGSRCSPDGRLRFTFNSDGVMQTEVRIHLPTNWRDSQGLCAARVSWVLLPPPPSMPGARTEPLQAPVQRPPSPSSPPSSPALPQLDPSPPDPIAPPAIAPRRVAPTDAEAFFQLFLTTCRLSDLISDIGRGVAGVTQVGGTSPRIADQRPLAAPNAIGAAADRVKQQVFDFSLQLRGLPQEGMVAAITALHDLLRDRIAVGAAAGPGAVTPVMAVDLTLPLPVYCQQVRASLGAAHAESTALFTNALQSLQLMRPEARNGLLSELRELSARLPPGPEREQRLWQIELLEVELLRRAGVMPLPQLRPRPLAVS